ncbi:MAG: hypothetical protein PF450_16770, partial [Bacteroidales bacterium]|nr:hypothetical protein [Bacteroidales bacterium]
SFDVSSILVEGENSIVIHFYSAEKVAYERNALLSYPVEHTIYPVQSMHRNLVRKAQCHSGWDWGPCLMTSGIYGEISLNSTPLEKINDVHTNIRFQNPDWSVEVHVSIFSSKEASSTLTIDLEETHITLPISLRKGNNTLIHTFSINNVSLWWASGYGKQPLYTLSVSTDHHNVKKTIGFRTIEVDTSSDKDGIGMTFIVNNTPIFAKGANWIVIDALPGRYTKEKYEDLLHSVVASHMNMVRVWGGGHYENDIFYDLCDQLGILVWQDCMFSCSLYPATDWFLESVKQEITYQVKRLKDHPSLALWCGNNEDVGALTWFESSRKERDKYLIDYDRLNEGIIGKTIKELDPIRKWWSSSPSAGESDYSDCWHDDSKGDMHYWSVWHEGKPFEAYKEIIPRFCSEFGFQSFPSLPLLTKVITHDGTKEVDTGEFNLSSSVMEHHQRNDRGNTIILSTMLRYFHLPSSFSHQIYISQIQQSFAMQTAIEYWRSNRPRCMGTLFWQLQDNWPVASWASIEYGGKWKALQYEAKRFYNPILLTFQKEHEKVVLIGVNDNTLLEEGTLNIQKVWYDGKVETLSTTQTLINAAGTTQLYRYEESSVDIDEEYCLYASFQTTKGELIENYYFPTFFKSMKLLHTTITATPNDENEITSFTITSNVVALYVSIDHPNKRIQLSDNFFHLMPHQQKVVHIENGALSKQDFSHLMITHLRETY